MAGLERVQDGPELFARLFNDGDLEGFVGLYEPGAVLVHDPGQPATGTEAIRGLVADLLQGKGTLSVRRRHALVAGELVLATYDWAISEGGEAGKSGVGAIVFRRQPDGSWRAILDTMQV